MDLSLNQGLAKYRVSKGVFSLRNSASILLADAAIVKGLVGVLGRPFTTGVFKLQDVKDTAFEPRIAGLDLPKYNNQ